MYISTCLFPSWTPVYRKFEALEVLKHLNLTWLPVACCHALFHPSISPTLSHPLCLPHPATFRETFNTSQSFLLREIVKSFKMLLDRSTTAKSKRFDGPGIKIPHPRDPAVSFVLFIYATPLTVDELSTSIQRQFEIIDRFWRIRRIPAMPVGKRWLIGYFKFSVLFYFLRDREERISMEVRNARGIV